MSKQADEQMNVTKNPTTAQTPETIKPIKLEKSVPTPKKGPLPSFKWLEAIADFIYDLFT